MDDREAEQRGRAHEQAQGEGAERAAGKGEDARGEEEDKPLGDARQKDGYAEEGRGHAQIGEVQKQGHLEDAEYEALHEDVGGGEEGARGGEVGAQLVGGGGGCGCWGWCDGGWVALEGLLVAEERGREVDVEDDQDDDDDAEGDLDVQGYEVVRLEEVIDQKRGNDGAEAPAEAAPQSELSEPVHAVLRKLGDGGVVDGRLAAGDEGLPHEQGGEDGGERARAREREGGEVVEDVREREDGAVEMRGVAEVGEERGDEEDDDAAARHDVGGRGRRDVQAAVEDERDEELRELRGEEEEVPQLERQQRRVGEGGRGRHLRGGGGGVERV